MRRSRFLVGVALLLVALAAVGSPFATLATSAAKQVVWRFDGQNSFEFQARTIGSGGDLDGDGVPDILVGMQTVASADPGNKLSARAYSGKTGAMLLSVNAPQ